MSRNDTISSCGDAENFAKLTDKMLSAIPFKNPTKIGLDKKSASAPRRRKLAPMQSNPLKKVKVTESERYRSLSDPASGATAAATSAQVAASGFTISCRDVPKTA